MRGWRKTQRGACLKILGIWGGGCGFASELLSVQAWVPIPGTLVQSRLASHACTCSVRKAKEEDPRGHCGYSPTLSWSSRFSEKPCFKKYDVEGLKKALDSHFWPSHIHVHTPL